MELLLNSIMPNPQDVSTVGSNEITKTNPAPQDKLVAVESTTGRFINVLSGNYANQSTTYTKTEVDGLVNAKANTTDVNTSLALKANITDVNNALALKANITDVNTALTTKVDKTSIENTLTSTDATRVLSAAQGKALNDSKANITDVNNALALKANISDVNTALTTKVDKASIENTLTSTDATRVLSAAQGKALNDSKANTTYVNNALNLKQDALGFTAENVANKTNSFNGTNTTLYTTQKAVNDGLLTKVDTNAISQIGWTTKLPTISINETTRVIALAVTNPNTSYDFYSQNKLLTKTSSEQVVFSNTEGVHLIYYDASGNLTDATTNFDFIIKNFATVTTFYWSVAQAKIIIGALNELHSSQIIPDIHYSLHKTFGTLFVSGLSLSINATGDGSVASHAQFSGAGGLLNDDGLELPILAKSLTDNFPLIYKSGASGNFVEVSPRTNFITTTGANGRAVYNQNNAGTWQLTELGSNDYNITYIYATTGLTTQYFGVISQKTYSSLNDAREGVKVPPDLGALPSAEYKLIGAILFQTASSYTNAVKTKIVAIDDAGTTYQDFRRITGIGAPASVSTSDLTAIYNSLATKQAIATLGSDISAKITNDANSTITKSLDSQDVTLDIKDASITNAKIANNAVDANKIADNSVANSKISSAANIATSKLQQTNITPVNTAVANDDTQDVINNKLQGQVNQSKTDITGLSNTKFDKAGGTITGDVIVSGNLDVKGTTTIIESTTVQVADKNIVIGHVDNPTDVTADGGGITLEGGTNNDKSLTWLNVNKSWNSSEHFNLASGKAFRINNFDINQITESLKNKTIDGTLNTFANIPLSSLASTFQSIYYVHGINGNDASNGLTPNTAFQTIAKANTMIGNAKALVIILEGTSENLTITNTNVSYACNVGTQTGQISLTGVVTVNSTSVISFFGMHIESLNHIGAGSLYLENCIISTAFTTTSSGFFRAVNTNMQNATVSITGTGYKNFFTKSTVGTLTVNNANAIVTIADSTCQNGITLTAGLCNLSNVEGFISGTTNNFIVTESGSTIVFNNVKLQNTNGTPAKINIKSGSLYWINNLCLSNGSSVISGNNVNSFVTRFENTYTNIAAVNDFTANALKFNGATADRALIYVGGQVATSSVTKANLETLLTGGNLNKLSTVTSATTDNYKVLTIKNDASGEYNLQLPVRNLTTAQRDALTNVPNGFIIYNSTDDKFQSYNETAWSNIVAAGTGNVSVTGLINASGKAPVYNNGNGTGLALLDTTVALNKLNYSKSTGAIPTLSTSERDALVVSGHLTEGSNIINSTENILQIYRNSVWTSGYKETVSSKLVNWINSGVNAGGTLLGNATWFNNSSFAGLRSYVVQLTSTTTGHKGIWYKNILPLSNIKRVKAVLNYQLGTGSGGDGMWISFFANTIPTTANVPTTINNSYTIYINEYANQMLLYYNGAQIKAEGFNGLDFGGAADYVRQIEFIFAYNYNSTLMYIEVSIKTAQGGNGMVFTYQDTVTRNLSGTYCIIGGLNTVANNYHIIKYFDIEPYFD